MTRDGILAYECICWICWPDNQARAHMLLTTRAYTPHAHYTQTCHTELSLLTLHIVELPIRDVLSRSSVSASVLSLIHRPHTTCGAHGRFQRQLNKKLVSSNSAVLIPTSPSSVTSHLIRSTANCALVAGRVRCSRVRYHNNEALPQIAVVAYQHTSSSRSIP